MEVLIPLEGPSVTGLQAKELMGLTVNAIQELTDSDATDFKKFYEELYIRSHRALQVDAQRILTGFFQYPDGTFVTGKFNLNKKIAAMETSQFLSAEQNEPGYAGVQLQWAPSQYSVIVVSYVQVYIKTLASPSVINLRIVDNERDPLNGGLLYEKQFAVNQGLNTLSIFQEFDVRNISILIDTSDQLFYQSKQRYFYNGTWIDEDVACTMPCAFGQEMISRQINGGGVNAITSVVCSMQKFITVNISLFALALYYSIGREFMKERISSDRVNKYTMLSLERSQQLLTAYEKDYIAALDTLRAVNSVPEDNQCFQCKSVVSTHNVLP